ncbi:hypothetical protein MMC19_002812 [Ptychographa xylographoides]|nr:hypothetical protein [Ptychographa xylographoides]
MASVETVQGKPPIILIHGLWMSPLCWNQWKTHYEAAGHEVVNPGWPGLDGRSVADIRKDPSCLKGLSIKVICDHYETIIRGMKSSPIIIGHSFGGLFVQILLSRGLGVAGIAIDPAAPAGVVALPWSQLKATAPHLANPFNHAGIINLTHEQFHYAFANELSNAESDVIFEEQAIPGDAEVLWQGVLGALQTKGEGAVRWDKPDRAPLLLIAGGNDHLVPPAVQKATLKHYHGSALVEYKEFAGRTHNTVGQTGWQEIADYALEFANKHMKK